MTSASTPNRQSGFSLVELMIAMVVALILLAGILQILLGNRESFDTQKTMAALQQDTRLAGFIFDHAIAHAGYRVDLEPALKYVFTDGFIASSDGGGTAPDKIRIRFQASGGVSDCSGQPVGNNAPAIADFEFSIDADNELQCRIFDDSGSVAHTVTLVSNVETMQVRYGLNTGDDDAVDSFTTSLTESQALQVRSVRIQLLLVSDRNALPAPVSQTFKFSDGQTLAFDDRRARKMVDQTIALRNLLP